MFEIVLQKTAYVGGKKHATVTRRAYAAFFSAISSQVHKATAAFNKQLA